MEYPEEDFLMLSGIQHFAFCKRQWALIVIEQLWDENIHTADGEIMHKRAHDPSLTEKSKNVIIVRSLPVHSRTLGLSGQCDVVEFHRCEDGIRLNGHKGFFSVYPVEYKKGRPKGTEIDMLQLAAEIMCLEEMFSTEIIEGSLYYGETRRREKVPMTEELRSKVCEVSSEMHEMYKRGTTPKVKWHKGCNACSLKEICLPRLGNIKSVKTYIEEALSGDVQ